MSAGRPEFHNVHDFLAFVAVVGHYSGDMLIAFNLEEGVGDRPIAITPYEGAGLVDLTVTEARAIARLLNEAAERVERDAELFRAREQP